MTGARSRAPRLAAHERLAPYLTRRGRFAAIDPAQGRPLPPAGRWLGFLAWAAFVAAVLWRARPRPGAALPAPHDRATLAAPAR